MTSSDYDIGASLMFELEDVNKEAAEYFDNKWKQCGTDGYVGQITAQGAMLRVIMSHSHSIQYVINQRVNELIKKYEIENNIEDVPQNKHDVIIVQSFSKNNSRTTIHTSTHKHNNNHHVNMICAAAYE